MKSRIPLNTMRIITLLACLVPAMGDAHMESDHSQNLVLLYGSQAHLNCSDHHFNPDDFAGARFQWVLPSGEVLTLAESETSDGHYELRNNGSALVISDIEKPDFGIYYCLVMVDSDFSIYTAVKWGINLDGPFFGDLSEKYAPRMRHGLIAGVVIFLVMSMFCYNYDSFQARHDKGGKPGRVDMEMSMHNYLQSGKTRSDMEMSHINPAYATDSEKSNSEEPVNEDDGGNEEAKPTEQTQEDKDPPKTQF